MSQVEQFQATNKKPDGAALIAGGAAKGAAAGAAFGPWGAAVGGVLGAAGGVMKKIGGDKAYDIAVEKTNIINENTIAITKENWAWDKRFKARDPNEWIKGYRKWKEGK